MIKKFFRLILCFFFLTNLFSANAQDTKVKVGCIGFYNLENLYDTIDNPENDDAEYLPQAIKLWNTDKYLRKLDHLAEVISQLGTEIVAGGPVIMGFSEVENYGVMRDLISRAPLNKMNYGIVHYDSPDRRGVDVGLIYQKNNFKVRDSKNYIVKDTTNISFRTRDLLRVSGYLDGDLIHIIVCHWPSRSGGELESTPRRKLAALNTRMIVEEIFKTEPDAKIIIMGDFNDDPRDISMVKHLGAKGKIEQVTKSNLFNPMWKLYKDGIGSLAYRDSWNLFDQTIVSYGLLHPTDGEYKFLKSKVFNKKFLTQKDGSFSGYPFRTYVGNNYMAGYSDHFPVYLFLTKEIK